MPPHDVDPAAIRRAADALRAGRVIAFPTETVYGLGAAISQEHAARRIFDLKRRPLSQPLLAHVDGVAMARALVAAWPQRAEELARRFWPGPLTMVIPKAAHVPDVVTGGGPTIGVRCPDHPVALELIRLVGEAVAGTSANRSGEPSPTRPEHVRRSFPADVVELLDAGPAPGGLESTVLLLGERAEDDRILRPGPISAADLGVIETSGDAAAHQGSSEARLALVAMDDVESALANSPGSAVITHHAELAPRGANVIPLPTDPAAYGRAMYDALHTAKSKCAEPGRILVVEPDEIGPLWDVIRQRLRRLSEKSGN